MRLYHVPKKRLTEPKNVGYAYKGRVMLNSMDQEILKNPKIKEMVMKIDDSICEWIDLVKRYKVYRNIYMDKDETQFN